MRLSDQEYAALVEEKDRYRILTDSIAAASKGWAGQGLELISIGDAAGSHCATQGMPTGGFLMRCSGRSVIVDPGSQTISFLRRHGVDPYELTDVVASHGHDNHVGDLSLAVSAALSLGLRRESDATIVVCPGLVDYAEACSTCYGFTLPSFAFDQSVAVISPVERRVTTADGIEIVSTRSAALAGGISVRAAPTRHGAIEGVGFVFDTPFGRLAYSGDTGYFRELEEYYAGSDALWLNLNTLGLRGVTDTGDPETAVDEPVANHLGYVGVCRLIEAVEPSVAIVSHFGAQLLESRDRIESLLRARFAGSRTEIHLARGGEVFRFPETLKHPPERGWLKT